MSDDVSRAPCPAWAVGLFFLFALVTGPCAQANTPPSVVGLWKTVDDHTHKERSLVRIREDKGIVTGHIEQILDPSIPIDAKCQSCTGVLHGKPLVGLVILSGLAASATDNKVWEGGQVLDPNNGKTFKVRLTLAAQGQELQVRGFVGSPMMGRTQVWVRAK